MENDKMSQPLIPTTIVTFLSWSQPHLRVGTNREHQVVSGGELSEHIEVRGKCLRRALRVVDGHWHPRAGRQRKAHRLIRIRFVWSGQGSVGINTIH